MHIESSAPMPTGRVPADVDPLSDEALVARFHAGDREAFGTLYSRYRKRVRNIARRFALDEADADDITQDAFLKAYAAMSSFRGECRFYTWMFRIAYNTGLNFRTRGLDTEPLDHHEPLSDESPESGCITDRRWRQTQAAIGGLPPVMRDALLLNSVSGFDYAQVAKMSRCPIGTVRSRIFRARAMVAEAAEGALAS